MNKSKFYISLCVIFIGVTPTLRSDVNLNELHPALHSHYLSAVKDLKKKPKDSEALLDKRIAEYYGLIMNKNFDKAYKYLHKNIRDINNEKNIKEKFIDYINKEFSPVHKIDQLDDIYSSNFYRRSIQPLHMNNIPNNGNDVFAYLAFVTFSIPQNAPDSCQSINSMEIWEKVDQDWYVIPLNFNFSAAIIYLQYDFKILK